MTEHEEHKTRLVAERLIEGLRSQTGEEVRRFRDTLEKLRKVRKTHTSLGTQLHSNVPEVAA